MMSFLGLTRDTAFLASTTPPKHSTDDLVTVSSGSSLSLADNAHAGPRLPGDMASTSLTATYLTPAPSFNWYCPTPVLVRALRANTC
jgi:hypothetical protein